MKNVFTVFITMLLLLMSGCGSVHKLHEKWEPLQYVVERPGNDTFLTTISPLVIVGDVDKFLERNPEDSATYEAFMAHEKWHALQQEKLGLAEYGFKYTTSREFRWEEEKSGWYIQFMVGVTRGAWYHADTVENSLKKYALKLASDEEIREFVDMLFSGQYQPSKEVEEFLKDF